jgi:hypothetical protein
MVCKRAVTLQLMSQTYRQKHDLTVAILFGRITQSRSVEYCSPFGR